MKKQIFVLFIIFFKLVNSAATAAEPSTKAPLETILLKFPDHSETNWKEINRFIRGCLQTL